jgi:hypothetical protein
MPTQEKTPGFRLIESLSYWFARPLLISASQSVAQVLDALNDHPLAQDEQAQDYVMPKKRYFDNPGRFRIWGENQDNFYCFVTARDSNAIDPPVYFETCLDLVRDCRIDPTHVLPGNCVLVTEHFTSFLSFMLAHHICLRLEKGSHLANAVNGIVFSQPLKTCCNLTNPLGREFIAGYTPYVGQDVICIPDWGAAFRNQSAREQFVESMKHAIGQSWA